VPAERKPSPVPGQELPGGLLGVVRTGHGQGLLVGRSSQLSELATALKQVADGAGGSLLVEGEAGIGKTSLVEESLRAPDQLGLQVYRATAEQLERRRPFGAIVDCLGIGRDAGDPRRMEIARLLHEVPPPTDWDSLVAAPPGEFRVAEAIVTLVEEVSVRGPLVVAIDDLQWADPSTILVLHRLGRSAHRLPVLLLCACRPLPRPPDLERLIASLIAHGGRRLVLGSLDQQAVVDLVEALVGAEPGPRLLRQVAGAGGNPLFVTELVGALAAGGSLEPTGDGRVEVAAVGIPPSLTLTILHRLSFLPQRTLDLLRAASVIGTTFTVAELSLVTGTPSFELLAALRESLTAGVLGEEATRLRFRHDLLQEALYHDLPGAMRAGLHLDTARALARAGAPAEQVAEHLLRGAVPGDAEAVAWLREAAHKVASHAPGIAVDLLRRALELADAAEPTRDRMLAELAVSLMWSGSVLEAEQLCRRVLARGHDPAVDGTLRLCLAQALLARGRSQDALDVADAAAAAPGLSETDRARLRAWASMGRLSVGDLDGAVRLAELAGATATQPADDLARCISMATLATVRGFRGRFAEAVELAEAAVRLADRSPGRAAHRFHLNFYLGIFLLDMDRLEEAGHALQRGRRLSEALGAKWSLPIYQWASALARFVAGDWDDASAECEACVELAEDVGTRRGVLFSHSLTSIIALHRNDLAAEDAAAAAERELAETGRQAGLEYWVLLARALLLEATGRPAAACETLWSAWRQGAEAGNLSYNADLGPDLVRLSLAAGQARRAAEVTAGVQLLAAANPSVARLEGAALQCRGLVTDDPGVLLQAVAAHRRGPRPLELARACEDAAVALVRAARPAEAAGLFDEALELYERLGAAHDTARVEAGLRLVGRRRGRRGPRGRPKSGWASLTTTEAKVAELVAEGLSNPEIARRLFVSRHTVHTHVSHILAKLGLGSRVELAAATARRHP
jgi:DNA-binding CsgD family transcriptional regulator/tetratricopeptide (TPR) repeat protein